jgi:hypothetical protein
MRESRQWAKGEHKMRKKQKSKWKKAKMTQQA